MKSSLYFLSPINVDILVIASIVGSMIISSNSFSSDGGPVEEEIISK